MNDGDAEPPGIPLPRTLGYWRFTTEGATTLFGPGLGLEVLSCHYQYPCRIVTPDDPGPVFNQAI
jgi:hypothetical protein